MHKLNSSHQLAAQQQEIEHVLKSKVCPIQKHCAPCWTSPWLCWSISEISKFCPAAMMGATQYVVVEPMGRKPRIRRRSRFELASRTLNTSSQPSRFPWFPNHIMG